MGLMTLVGRWMRRESKALRATYEPRKCTLTTRRRDCWEHGCEGHSGCEFMRASADDRRLANKGKLPEQRAR